MEQTILRACLHGSGWLGKAGWFNWLNCFAARLHMGVLQPNQRALQAIWHHVIIYRLITHAQCVHFQPGWPGLARLHVFTWEIFISAGQDLGSVRWDLSQAGWLVSHVNTSSIFSTNHYAAEISHKRDSPFYRASPIYVNRPVRLNQAKY